MNLQNIAVYRVGQTKQEHFLWFVVVAFCGENCMHIGQNLFKWQRIKNHMSKNAMLESQVSVTYLFQLRR